ncbi:MAG: S26 family signal peptidase, partial [Tidjanibacter sp.]|nr:S26 family signal peptidase [Tidjanibacter sp.]
MKEFFRNKWVKFAIVAIVYVLWFVVWTESLWMLLGLPIIFDLYIAKFLARLLRLDKHRQRKQTSKVYKEVWSWIDAIVFALIFATLINTYAFQMYQIPTSSMEKTLLVGDYLYVSKATYGPRLPNTPLSLPLMHNVTPWGTKSYSEAVKWPYKRLAG